jgi:hypothetical protein
LPPSGPPAWDGTATAGAALYLAIFAAALWGVWLLVRSGPGSDPGEGAGGESA